MVSKYCELFVFTDPFQDKTETLTTCYEELAFTCDRLLLLPSPGSMDVHLHMLSYARLQDIHIKTLQAQHTWLVEKCLCHQVPTAKELMLMVGRQARLLEVHEKCKLQLQKLLVYVRSGVEKGEVYRSRNAKTGTLLPPPVAPCGQYDLQQHRKHEEGGPAAEEEEQKEEEKQWPHPPTVASSSTTAAKLPPSLVSCELLYTLFDELLAVTHVIFRIYPAQEAKLRSLYRATSTAGEGGCGECDLKGGEAGTSGSQYAEIQHAPLSLSMDTVAHNDDI